MRLTEFPKWHPVTSLAPIFSKLRDHHIPIPSEKFSLVEYKKDSRQKGRMLVLLKSQSISLFPLINFFSCLTARLALFFSALAIQRLSFFLIEHVG